MPKICEGVSKQEWKNGQFIFMIVKFKLDKSVFFYLTLIGGIKGLLVGTIIYSHIKLYKNDKA